MFKTAEQQSRQNDESYPRSYPDEPDQNKRMIPCCTLPLKCGDLSLCRIISKASACLKAGEGRIMLRCTAGHCVQDTAHAEQIPPIAWRGYGHHTDSNPQAEKQHIPQNPLQTGKYIKQDG
ncbi:hypothetical protein D3C73_795570 [compost metagenome]